MKTWEMIEELAKNPDKSFKRLSDGLEVRNTHGRFNWESGHAFLGVEDEWDEAKEPITFIEAVRSKKEIKVEHYLIIGCILDHYMPLSTFLYELSCCYTNDQVRDIILNGKYYI